MAPSGTVAARAGLAELCEEALRDHGVLDAVLAQHLPLFAGRPPAHHPHPEAWSGGREARR